MPVGFFGRRNILDAALAGLLLVWFVSQTIGASLSAGFTGDDVMNMWQQTLREPWPKSLVNIFNITTPLADGPVARGAGALFYYSLYEAFGFSPAPFHIALRILLLLNLAVWYGVARELAGSWPAFLGLLLVAYQPTLADIYHGTHTVYDTLCSLFLWGAFLVYVRGRRDGERISRQRLVAVFVLAYLAVASKEMAAALPIFIGLYEVLFHQRRDYRGAVITGLLVFAAAAGKLYRSLGKPVGGYGLTISWTTFADNWAHYFRWLTSLSIPVSSTGAIAALVSLILLAALLRDRAALLGALVFVIGAMPIIFASPRNLYALFVPFLGLGLWAGPMLFRLTQAIRVPSFVAALTVGALVGWWSVSVKERFTSWVVTDSEPVRKVLRAVETHRSMIGKDTAICFDRDPFRGDGYGLFFTVSLYLDDPAVRVMRPKDPCPAGAVRLTLQ